MIDVRCKGVFKGEIIPYRDVGRGYILEDPETGGIHVVTGRSVKIGKRLLPVYGIVCLQTGVMKQSDTNLKNIREWIRKNKMVVYRKGLINIELSERIQEG